MSAVSGLTSKGENKSKQKYQSLNINNLYKGKSLENPKTSVAPKHGLQTLGKVGAGRRMPPPANLPSLKSQISGNPNINLVPTGGQGWGSGKEEDSGATPPLQTSSTGPEVSPLPVSKPSSSNPLLTSSSASTVSNVGAIAGGLASAAMNAASKTWNTSTATASEESGPDKSYLAQQSPFFPQEFPKLDGGNVPQDATTKVGSETSYGPGPALRPQTEGSWGRGTLPQSNANQPPNVGSGGSGRPPTPPLQPNDPSVQMSRGLYPQPMTALQQQRPPIPGSVVPPANQAPGQAPLVPGQTSINYNQYRMMAQYPSHMAYSRGPYPSGSYPPQGYAQQPHGPGNTRPTYFPDSRGQQIDEEPGGRPRRPAPPIITDKDLKGFDEILENEVQSGWAAANTEIDYNAKLVFSDDEDNHQPKDSSNYDEPRDRNDIKHRDWDRDRRDYDDRREDNRPKYRAPQQHQHSPQQQQIPPTNARVNNFEYAQHSPQSAQYSRQQMHSSYSHSRHNRSEPIVADEDEMWRQRSRQQSDEMAAAVIRARQRREEEEKEIARSRQAAHEKLKALEEKSMGKDRDRNDSNSMDFDQCSRHSNDSKEDKVSNRDSRDPRFSNSFQATKVYPKNVPPRFQKQAELMRQTQQTTGPPSHSPPFEHRYNRQPSESDARDIRNLSNNGQLPNKVPPVADISRSNSQISSGHESYESERERRTPDDRRQRQSSQSGSESNNWRAVQTQRHSMSESKDQLVSTSRPSDDRDGDKCLQKEVKKANDDNKTDFKELKPKVESNESFSEKRNLIERQESSHSDKRSTSSKEDRYSRKYERLDWAAESESLLVTNTTQKRDHPRHRPITQKEFESFTEPIKKNFTPLRKNNLSNISSISDEHKDSSTDKTKEDFRKIETPLLNQIGTNVDNSNQIIKSKQSDPLKTHSTRDENRIEQKDTDKQYDREKESGDLSKEDKSSRKSHSLRYESYSSRGKYSGQSYRGSRGREYRRTRQSSEKSYQEAKPSSSPGSSRNKPNKSIRRKSNSDESCVSEETKKESKNQSIDSNSGLKDKLEDEKDRSMTSDIVMSSSATANVMPNQRNDSLSRRGRGAAAFKHSTRGLPRAYGPSNYGPPPSRAAFGDGVVMKSESDKSLDQNRNEKNCESSRHQSSKSSKDETNSRTHPGQTANQFHDNNRNSISNSRKTNAFNNRNPGNSTNFGNNNRSETLPPRFQKRHNRGSQPKGDRSRHLNERGISSNQMESDLANNEEWETASENSENNDRGDRKTKKSSSSDPRNDSRHHNRKSDNKRNDSSRGQHPNNSGNQPSHYRNSGRNRNQPNVSNSRQTNANQRNGPIGSSNHSENITVCAISELTLDNPKAVEEALSDIKNRCKTSTDSIDDQINSETEDGFQTVSYKKRNRLNQGNDSKKFKHELSPKSKAGAVVRSSQRKLPPRFAKQKENNRLNTLSNEAFASTAKLVEDFKSLSVSSKTNDSSEKTSKDKIEMTVQTKVVPNAWNKPLSHSSQTTAISAPIMTSTKTATNTTNCISHDIQALSVSSKSSSFDQHDSGIDVSDQPPSTASSQRSSPSNDENKLITTTAKVSPPTTAPITDVRPDIGSDIDAAKPMCTVIFENTRYKEENKVLAKIAPAKSPTAKDMFVTTTSVTTNVVTETCRTTQPLISPKKIDAVLNEDFSANDKIQSTNVAKVVGMQRNNMMATTAPTESELNKKIASVKSVWESPSMTATIDSKSENTKNVLLNTLITTTEDKKLMSNESHTPDGIHANKVSERTTPKVEYSITSSVETISSLVKSRTPSMTYSTPTPNQMSSQSYVSSHLTQSQPSLISSQQILLNAISSPPLTETLRPMSAHQQQYQVHNMATSPAISTPPTMLYNSHVAAHNVYQTFGPQIDNLHQTQIPTVMAQFGPQHSSPHYQQHLLQPQQSQISAANIFMAHQLAAQPSAEQFKFNVAQQSLAKSLLSNQFVHQSNSTLQQTLSNASNWTTPTPHSQTNNQTPSYYPQSSSVGSALQAHQQHFAFQSQQSLGLMSGPSQQAAAALVQQSYRATPLSMRQTQTVDPNPMAANLRSMFAGNMMNDFKIGNSVNQTLDNRNANNRTTFNYNQNTGLQQLQQQQQQMFANQKFTGRAILPIYAQQMLGQTALSSRPNSASMLTSNVNSANSYTTPIQRPKLNRNNQSYNKSSHPAHHLSAPQIHQTHQPIHQTHPQQVAVSQSQLSSAQQAKMRQEAVRQTQSFFAQSSLSSTKNESQNESQSCGEVSAESLTQDCVNSDSNIKGLNDNKMPSIDKNE